MSPMHKNEPFGSAPVPYRIFAAIELSKATWVVAIQLPIIDKISLFRIAGGDIKELSALLERAHDRVGDPVEICTCYEAGYDGFWIHRALAAQGLQNTVLLRCAPTRFLSCRVSGPSPPTRR